MALRTAARYGYGLKFVRLQASNDDLSVPTASRIIGGAGPFDFSGVTDDSAVPITGKLDDSDAVSFTVDVSGASSASAVTVDELVSALDTAFTGEALELDASKSAIDDNRLKIETTDTSTTPTVVQIYGLCAEIAKLGQGFGAKYVKLNTAQSLSETMTRKESEQLTITDAEGKDTEINTDDYLKGFTAVLTDTAHDWELRSLIQGGSLNDDEDEYDYPTSASDKIYFFGEAYYAEYTQGDHLESDIVGYVKKLMRKMKGNLGDVTQERNWSPWVYNLTGTSYTDESGNMLGAIKDFKLTISEYEALNLESV
jgi:hypothetical protein